jgi:hypothetical protein
MRKFVQQSRVRIFHNERTRSTHLNPNSCFGAFWTVSLLQELRCKTGRTGAINALVRGTKSHRNFSRGMHPIHPIGPQTHVLWRFGPFCYCTNFGAKLQLLHNRAMKSCWNFSQRTHLIHPIWTQTHVLGLFSLFRYYKNFGAKWAELVQLMHNFMQRSWWGHRHQRYIHTYTSINFNNTTWSYYSRSCSSGYPSSKFTLKLRFIIFRQWRHMHSCFNKE